MFMMGLLPLWSCSAQQPPVAMENHAKPDRQAPTAEAHFRGLYDRQGDAIVEADPEDADCARNYQQLPAKGIWADGMRLTLATPRQNYQAGESVHVLHFVEREGAQAELYIMGPKPVFGESVDGVRRTPDPEMAAYPWVSIYDGEVMPGPGVDYNFEISKYTFDQAGTHEIVWQLGSLRSNVLTITVE